MRMLLSTFVKFKQPALSEILLKGILIPFLAMTMFSSSLEAQVKIGLEVLLEDQLDLIKGKKLGIIANHTSLDAAGKHIVDLLRPHTRVTAILGPEHGFRGNVEDAAAIRDGSYHGIPIYSLYGDFLSPTPKMLTDVDVLIYDIQDVGVKFYTYMSNLFLAMAAAKREGIPVIVLDRPNPINADIIAGAITNPAFSSFVGVIPLPIRYGMTVGELARLFNRESYGGFFLDIDLTVIKMAGYKRSMWFDETGFPWRGTSPNMQTLETAVIYPGMCLLEGTNLSEGRGTDSPFLAVGAPYLDGQKWLAALPPEVLAGLEVKVTEFRPQAIPGVVSKPKYLGQGCQGLAFRVVDRDKLDPIVLTVALLCGAQKLYPQQFKMTTYLDKLWGNEELRAMVREGMDYLTILKTCQPGIERFKQVREKYLFYE
jgi:uncharacterized protein YbbC (DUF1343 family)